ncbi:MAG: Hsp20/alpha crystallin family protein [Myxococcota bacterium]
MNLIKWDPFRELEDMSTRMNRLFRRDLVRAGPEGWDAVEMAPWAPVVDIKETPEEYLIKAELPEVKREDIKVEVRDGMLTIQGERKQEKEEKKDKFHRIERTYGNFMRSFMLPTDVDPAKVMAVSKDGVLNVHLPKSAISKPRAVEVKVS